MHSYKIILLNSLLLYQHCQVSFS